MPPSDWVEIRRMAGLRDLLRQLPEGRHGHLAFPGAQLQVLDSEHWWGRRFRLPGVIFPAGRIHLYGAPRYSDSAPRPRDPVGQSAPRMAPPHISEPAGKWSAPSLPCG